MRPGSTPNGELIHFMGREHDECGLTIIDVMIAFVLFIVIALPVAYLITESGSVTGQQRAKAIATELATQVARYGPNSEQSTSVSGIDFTTRVSCTSVSTVLLSVSVPEGKEAVTVTWGADHSHSIQLTRWIEACP